MPRRPEIDIHKIKYIEHFHLAAILINMLHCITELQYKANMYVMRAIAINRDRGNIIGQERNFKTIDRFSLAFAIFT